MAKAPVTNTTRMPIYVMGSMIPPGETRHFDEADLPPEFRPAQPEPEEAPPPDLLKALLDKPAKDVMAALAGLGDADIGRLEDLEKARGNHARRTVLEAIKLAILERAANFGNIGGNSAGNIG